MIPLSKLHKHISVPLWYFSIFIFFMAAIYFTQKVLAADDKKVFSKTFYFLAILMSLRFLLGVVQRVQSDALVLFLVSLFFFALFYQKDILAGIALASAAMVKLTPLIFLSYLLLRKKNKAAIACGCSILFYLFIPAAYVGMNKNWGYLQNWFGVHQNNPADYLLWYKNQSLLSSLLKIFSKDSAVALLNLDQAKILTIFIILAVILFSLIFIFPRKTKAPTGGFSYLVEISLLLILMILFSPLAWKHTFVHLIIPHLVLLYYIFYLNPRDQVTKTLLISSFLINTVLNPELTKSFAQLIQEYSNVTWGTLLLYFALLRISVKYADACHYSHI